MNQCSEPPLYDNKYSILMEGVDNGHDLAAHNWPAQHRFLLPSQAGSCVCHPNDSQLYILSHY
jgi:hypothetical protein